MARIGIVGSGMIGRAWALVFAQAGHEVRVWDPAPGAAQEAAARVGEQLAHAGHAGAASAAVTHAGAVAVAATLEACVRDADHVQENGPEDIDARRALFAQLDALAPPAAVLASSTSGMPPSTFTEGLAHRERCLVAHPANPPHLLPLVELCPAPWTSEAAMQGTAQLMRAAGRQVAVLRKEREGFLLNRLQGALLAEAFRLVADGVAGVEDIDNVIKHALGLRWAFMGPFETVDLNAPGGIADFCGRYGALYESLQQQMPPRAWDDPLVGAVAAQRRALLPLDDLPSRQAWRDEALAALARHLAGLERS